MFVPNPYIPTQRMSRGYSQTQKKHSSSRTHRASTKIKQIDSKKRLQSAHPGTLKKTKFESSYMSKYGHLYANNNPSKTMKTKKKSHKHVKNTDQSTHKRISKSSQSPHNSKPSLYKSNYNSMINPFPTPLQPHSLNANQSNQSNQSTINDILNSYHFKQSEMESNGFKQRIQLTSPTMRKLFSSDLMENQAKSMYHPIVTTNMNQKSKTNSKVLTSKSKTKSKIKSKSKTRFNSKSNHKSSYKYTNTNDIASLISPLSHLLQNYENQSNVPTTKLKSHSHSKSHPKSYSKSKLKSKSKSKSNSKSKSKLKKQINTQREMTYNDEYSTQKQIKRRMISTHHGNRKSENVSEIANVKSEHVSPNSKSNSNSNIVQRNEKKRNKSKSDPWNVKSLSMKDINIKSMLGEGAFSKVYLVKFKNTEVVNHQIDKQLHSKHLAFKMIERKNKKKDKHFEWETYVLSQLSHPFIVQYYGSFVDQSKICILMEFVIGGEILYHFENSKYGRFGNSVTQFYIGEVICALEYLHEKSYVYRDLKPENILLDNKGHIKIVDFGFAKKLNKFEQTYTLCGSKEYVAPEVLTGHGHGFAADYWSLGVLTYEFIVGNLPFPTQQCNPYQVLDIIQSTNIKFPNYISSSCVAFIKQLLIMKPQNRLGCTIHQTHPQNQSSGQSTLYSTSFQSIKNHFWFKTTNFDWELCNSRGMRPPIIPQYSSNDDSSNFATARFDLSSNNDDQLIAF